MPTTKAFHFGTVLTILTGRLLSPNGIDDVYDVLNFMTADNLMTHQLPEASETCRPYLQEQLDYIPIMKVRSFEGMSAEDVLRWRDSVSDMFDLWHEVAPLPPGVWADHDPIADLRKMTGVPIVIVVGNDE